MLSDLFLHYLPTSPPKPGEPILAGGGEQARAELAGLAAALGLSVSEAGIVFLFSAHPSAELILARTLAVGVTITDQAAADWIKENWPPAAAMALARGTVNRAFHRWMAADRGAAAAKNARNKKRWIFKALAASEWAEQQRAAMASAEERWADNRLGAVVGDDARCCATLRDVAPSLNEGMNKSFFPNGQKPAQQKTTDPAAAFAALPDEVWLKTESHARAYWLVRSWWNTAGDARPDLDCTVFLGAVLAARENAHSNPVKYAADCVARGLFDHWKATARRLMAQQESKRADGAVPVPR